MTEGPKAVHPRPIEGERRLTALDALRGFALLGILLVNLMGVSGVVAREGAPNGLADRVVTAFITYGARGVFLSLFAMLFGVGFAMLIGRLGRVGERRGTVIYLRRMLVLLAFGVVHVLLEPTDVLVPYALCGTVLLLCRRLPSRWVLVAALLLMPVPYLHTAVMTARPALAVTPAEEDPWAWNPYRSRESVRVHAEGDLVTVMRFNAQVAAGRLAPTLASLVWLTVPLPLMLLGMLLARHGLGAEPGERTTMIPRAVVAGAVGAAIGRAGGAALLRLAGRAGWDPWLAMAGEVTWVLGGYALAVAYAAVILLLLRRDRWRPVLLPLRFVGRMSLTNYLLQTVLTTTLFYRYGLGLFGTISAATAAGLAVLLFSGQLAASAWWLGRFHIGPAEWLWRSLSYGRAQPMRRPI